jgi:hypothetical protein
MKGRCPSLLPYIWAIVSWPSDWLGPCGCTDYRSQIPQEISFPCRVFIADYLDEWRLDSLKSYGSRTVDV